MSDSVYPAPAGTENSIDAARATAAWQRSVEDPDGYWREEARRLD